MNTTTKLLSKPFEIYVPATENREARKVATIEVHVRVDEDGDEVLTPESLDLIDKTQARYMGLLMGEDIRALRERLKLSQDELSDLLGCGKKSLSRWENGRGYPSQLVNTLLRALEESLLTPTQLRGLQEPRADWTSILYADAMPLSVWNTESMITEIRMGGTTFSQGQKTVNQLEGHWMRHFQGSSHACPSFKTKSVATDDWVDCPSVKRGQMNHLCLVGS